MGGLVAVTFTEKAAGELKLRLRQELEKARADDDAGAGRARGARSGAAQPRGGADRHHPRLLRRPAEGAPGRGGRRPALRRAHRGSGAPALRRGVRVVVPGGARGDARGRAPLAAAIEPSRRRRRRRTPTGPVDRLRSAGWNLAEWRDFPASWTRPEFARASEIDRLTTCVQLFAQITQQGDEPARSAVPRHGAGAARERRAAAAHRGRRPRRRRGAAGRPVPRPRLPAGAQGVRAAVREGVQRAPPPTRRTRSWCCSSTVFKRDADADLAALLRDELQGSLDRYRRAQGAAGRARLLRSAAPRPQSGARPRRRARRAPGALRPHLRRRVPGHRSAAGRAAAPARGRRSRASATGRRVRPVPGKLFIVGDPKQSIYRFRRADVQVYHQVCRQLLRPRGTPPDAHDQLPQRAGAAARGQRGVRRARWSRTPTRCRPATCRSRRAARRSGAQPSVVALPVPRPYGKRNVSAMADRAVAARRGRRVHRLAGARERMDGDHAAGAARAGAGAAGARLHPVPAVRQLRHRRHARRTWTRSKRAASGTCWSAAGRSTTARRSRRCGRRWRPSNGPTTSCRCSPRCAARCSRSATRNCSNTGTPTRGRCTRSGCRPTCRRTSSRSAPRCACWRGCTTQRNRRPVAETVARLLDATRAHVGFALRRERRAGAGQRAARGGAGAPVRAQRRPVVPRLRRGAARGGRAGRRRRGADRRGRQRRRAPDDRAQGQGAGVPGGRPRRHHGEAGARSRRAGQSTWRAAAARCGSAAGRPMDLLARQAEEHGRDLAEGVRLAYVAATRARDLLVVPAVGDEPFDGGWVSPLNRAIYPPAAQRRTPGDGAPAARRSSATRCWSGPTAASRRPRR